MKKEKNTEAEVEKKASKKDVKSSENIAPAVTKIGTMLKNVRLEKGLKLVDVAKRLCIRKQYLEAIEDSNYSDIPAFPYGVGFIRSYAEFLGLNSSNIVELYKEETMVKIPAEINISEPQEKSAMPGFLYIVISLLAIGAVYCGWMYLGSGNTEDDQMVAEEQADSSNDMIVIEELNYTPEQTVENSDSVDVEIVSQEPVAEVMNTSVAEPVMEVKSEPKADEYAVSAEEKTATSEEKPAVKIPSKGVFIEVLEETWIEVKTELKLYLSKVLKAGDSYMLPDDKGLILSVGKRDGVNVYVNGVKTDIAHTGRKMNIDIDSYLNANH